MQMLTDFTKMFPHWGNLSKSWGLIDKIIIFDWQAIGQYKNGLTFLTSVKIGP